MSMLQGINIVSQRAIMLGKPFQLSIKFRGIIKCNHRLFCFSPQFCNQIIKRSKPFTCKLTLFRLFVPQLNGISYKLLFFFRCGVVCDKLIYCHTFDCSKNLLQTWNETGIFNIKNNLCHTFFN